MGVRAKALTGSPQRWLAPRTLLPRQWRTASIFLLSMLAGALLSYTVLYLSSADCTAPATDDPQQDTDSFLALEHDGGTEQVQDNEPAAEQVGGGPRPVRAAVEHDRGSCVLTAPNALPSPNDAYRAALPDAVRPRHLVLIGVMTTAKFVDTRAVAGYRTWGRHFAHLAYFSSQGTRSRYGLPVVGLNGIDDEYPPQRKAFAMLRYFAVHLSARYSFFMRLDDDVYVRTDRLQRVLAMLSRDADLYIGQPGEGNKKEKKSLGVESWRYCMGGPGVVYSRTLLVKLLPHINYCLTNLMASTHEDVEVGRCLHLRLGISCSWNIEMAKLFFHGFQRSMIYSDQVHSKHLRYAVTVHPLKEPHLVYRLHHFYLSQEILRKEHEQLLMNTSMIDLMPFLKEATLQDLAQQELKRRRDASEHELQQPWLEAYGQQRSRPPSPTVMSHFSPFVFHAPLAADAPQAEFRGGPYRASLKATLGRAMYHRSHLQRGTRTHYTRLNEGFVAFDPLVGYHLVADSQLTQYTRRDGGGTVPKERTERIEVRQTFGKLVASRERITQLRTVEPIHLAVTVAAGRAERFDGFVDALATVLTHSYDSRHTKLLVALCLQRTKANGVSAAVAERASHLVGAAVERLRAAHPALVVRVRTAPGRVSADFAVRCLYEEFGAAWSDGAGDDLVMLADESVRFRPGVLRRCRLNAATRSSVYLPVVFGLYATDVARRRKPFAWAFSGDAGTWLTDFYGVACFHARDLNVTLASRGGAPGATPLWDEEEMALLASAVVAQGLDTVRAPDPELYREHVGLATCSSIRKDKLRFHCAWQEAVRLGTRRQLLRVLSTSNEMVARTWLPIADEAHDKEDTDPLAF